MPTRYLVNVIFTCQMHNCRVLHSSFYGHQLWPMYDLKEHLRPCDCEDLVLVESPSELSCGLHVAAMKCLRLQQISAINSKDIYIQQ